VSHLQLSYVDTMPDGDRWTNRQTDEHHCPHYSHHHADTIMTPYHSTSFIYLFSDNV